MEIIEDIVKVYEYIKGLEQENEELKKQLDEVRKCYKELNKEVIELELSIQQEKK